MKLIDADKLIEDIEEIAKTDMMKMLVERWINKQPTAFDVEKVVEQLEELANSDVCCNIEGCPYMGNNDINCENCAVFQTIPIVKAGGIDE